MMTSAVSTTCWNSAITRYGLIGAVCAPSFGCHFARHDALARAISAAGERSTDRRSSRSSTAAIKCPSVSFASPSNPTSVA